MAWEIVSSETVQVEDTNPKVWRNAAEVDINKGRLEGAIEKTYKAKKYAGSGRMNFLVHIVILISKQLSSIGEYQRSSNVIFDILGKSHSELAMYKECKDLYLILAKNSIKLGFVPDYIWYMSLYVFDKGKYIFDKIINLPILPLVIVAHTSLVILLKILNTLFWNLKYPDILLGHSNKLIDLAISLFITAFTPLEFDLSSLLIFGGDFILAALISPITVVIIFYKIAFKDSELGCLTLIWLAAFIYCWGSILGKIFR